MLKPSETKRLLAVIALSVGLLSGAAQASLVSGSSEISAAPVVSARSAGTSARFGLEITAGTSGFGTQQFETSAGGLPFTKKPLRTQFDVHLLESIGVVGVGPSLEYYFTEVADGYRTAGAVPGVTKAVAVGAQARYQARYFEWQTLVPMISYSFEKLNYRLSDGARGWADAKGLTVGAWLYLNALDRATAASFRRELGVSRTYITFERRTLLGADERIALSGSSYQLGMRFEL
ncbi:MAG: hypothetical protein NDJ89_15455 [Oligoflexia bacterium]|nr:hypothetical protein [Oligoflexia bacterium]